METDKVLGLLGIAYRARRLICGTDGVVRALQAKKVHLLFVANDASDKTKDMIKKKGFFYSIDVEDRLSTEQLSQATGKEMARIVAVTDQGFSDSFKKLLK